MIKKMKYFMSIVMLLTMVVALASGCSPSASGSQSTGGSSSGNTQANGSEPTQQGKTKVIEIVLPKPEIKEAVQRTANKYNEYMAGKGVEVKIEAFADNYPDFLRTRLASGDMLDAWAREPYNQTIYWLDYIEPLTDQPWVSDLPEDAKSGYIWGGELYAFPLGYEAYGMWYHKNLIAEAGWDEFPKTYDEMVQMNEDLLAAGITPTLHKWSKLEIFLSQTIFSYNGDKSVEETFLDVVNNKVRMKDLNGFKWFTKWVDLTVKYGAKDQEDAVGIDAEIKSKFAAQQFSWCLNGVWSEPSYIVGGAPELAFTVVPYTNDVEANRMPAGVPSGFLLNKDSDVLQETKDFFVWLHAQGTKELVEGWAVMPAFKSMSEVALQENMLNISNTAAAKLIEEERTETWVKYYYNETAQPVLLAHCQAYILGEITADELGDALQQTFIDTFTPFPE